MNELEKMIEKIKLLKKNMKTEIEQDEQLYKAFVKSKGPNESLKKRTSTSFNKNL